MNQDTFAKMAALAGANKTIVAPIQAGKSAAIKPQDPTVYGVSSLDGSVLPLPAPSAEPEAVNLSLSHFLQKTGRLGRPADPGAYDSFEMVADTDKALKMPSTADFSGASVLDAVVKNLAAQLEYNKALAAYWRAMYERK